MAYFICNDLGCMFKLDKDGQVMYNCFMTTEVGSRNYITDEWNHVDTELVGEERVEFDGKNMSLYEVYDIVRGLLK